MLEKLFYMPVRNWVWKGYRYYEVYQNATKQELIITIKCNWGY